MQIELPHNWEPRSYQARLWSYLEHGGKRAAAIWHRRAGKDEIALNFAAVAAHKRIGSYWHMLPEASQARKAIWQAVNPHTGRRRIDEAFPLAIRASTNETEMLIKFKSGSTWQVVGSDNYQSLVGAPPVGLVFSEWSKAHPAAWAYLAPILVENGGWALFITTPEGKNHAYGTYDIGRRSPAWFAERLTVEDTIAAALAAGERPPITIEDVEAQRLEYRQLFGEEAGDALIEQEFFCSFEAAVLGAYWGKQMAAAEAEGRICQIDRIPGYPVNTAWDIGVDDPMAIWVFQSGPGWLHVIDYIEGSNAGFDHYCDWLDERGYRGGIDYVPHDAKQREPGAPRGRTRVETLIELRRNPRVIPAHKVMDQINAVRRLLPRLHFDEVRCKRGLDCLRNYRQEWDETNLVFMRQPKHDQYSHGASAMCTLALAVEIPQPKAKNDAQALDPAAIRVNDLLRRAKPDRRWA